MAKNFYTDIDMQWNKLLNVHSASFPDLEIDKTTGAGISIIKKITGGKDLSGYNIYIKERGLVPGTGILLDPNHDDGDSILMSVDTDVFWPASRIQSEINTATAGLASSLHVPVADLAAARAITDYKDKMLLHIETLGLYRYEAESTAADNGTTVIKPNDVSGAGRWLRMNSPLDDHNSMSGIQGGASGDYQHLTTSQVTKLNGVSAGATKTEASSTNGNIKINGAEVTVYTHPATHPPSIIAQDANNRFVTDSEKAAWNAKPKKYSATIGNGTATSITVVHNLGTEDIVYSLREVSTKAFVETDVAVVDANTIRLTFAIAPAANSLRLVVIG